MAWSAKKQAVVSRSSIEAEYRSLAISTAELFWLHMLFKELCIPFSLLPVLWCDNVSALALASNPLFHLSWKVGAIKHDPLQEKRFHKKQHVWRDRPG